MKRLGVGKERLVREKRAKEQCVAELHTKEKVAEWRRVVLVTLLSEAGLSRAPPRQPERGMKGAFYCLNVCDINQYKSSRFLCFYLIYSLWCVRCMHV